MKLTGKYKKILIGALLLFLSAPGNAASLGRLRLNSNLGQPLNVEIDISASDAEYPTLKVGLAPREVYVSFGLAYQKYFSELNFLVKKRSNGSFYILITSERPMTVVFNYILVFLSSYSGKSSREYAFLLPSDGGNIAGDKSGGNGINKLSAVYGDSEVSADEKSNADLIVDSSCFNKTARESAVNKECFPGGGLSSSELILLRAIEKWKDAWCAKNLAAYFMAYSSNFVPEKGKRAEWESLRKSRILAASGVSIDIKYISFFELNDYSAVVRFRQIYNSSLYSDVVDKILTFEKSNMGWLIVKENVVYK